MPAPQPLPMSLQQFVHQQPTLPSERLVDPAETRQYPYGTYWWRAIAGILLAGRVQPRHDRSPNMTDVNRLCKEANFNQYVFERVGPILLAFSQLPEADVRQALEQLGQRPEIWHSLYWTPWLDTRGQQVVLSALYMCEWAYVVEYQGQEWFCISDTARFMLGLEGSARSTAADDRLQSAAEFLCAGRC